MLKSQLFYKDIGIPTVLCTQGGDSRNREKRSCLTRASSTTIIPILSSTGDLTVEKSQGVGYTRVYELHRGHHKR